VGAHGPDALRRYGRGASERSVPIPMEDLGNESREVSAVPVVEAVAQPAGVRIRPRAGFHTCSSMEPCSQRSLTAMDRPVATEGPFLLPLPHMGTHAPGRSLCARAGRGVRSLASRRWLSYLNKYENTSRPWRATKQRPLQAFERVLMISGLSVPLFTSSPRGSAWPPVLVRLIRNPLRT
jgi:hypothetical protein